MMIVPLVVLHLALLQDAAAPAQPPAAAPPEEPSKPAAPATTFGEVTTIEAFEQSLRQLATASGGTVTLTSIGTSTAGRPIHVLQVTSQANRKVPVPSVLIVAGLDGWHRTGSLVAAGIAERFALERRAAIDARTVLDGLDLWVIPVANPDAWAAGLARPQDLAGRVGAGIDDDRDGRIDEDAPRDINGDGVISMMRRLECPSDAPATRVADPADPRLDRAPDGAKGELAAFALMVEGLDQDGDGSVGEDAVGGITVDANFPHLWREFAEDAGRFPLEAPEAKALAEFIRTHPGLGAVYVLGRQDSLARTPNHERRDITGRTPVFIDGDDKGLYERIGTLYRASTGIERARDASHEGSFAAWCYAHRGLPTFCSQVWQRPDPSPPPEEKKDAPKPTDEDAAAWLAWSDRDQGGRGFMPWRPFDHPTLGKVEIGGWVPGFRTEPPAAMVPELTAKHAAFVASLAGESARVRV
ncbi:MAG: M14 family zinc carboxypeptidase, partial [Phycisphaerales bacterium]